MTNKKRVLLIGWDGADWEHINPLLDDGLMPTLNTLVDGGTIGNLATLQPVLSPMLWNSVATGKFADKHGIFGFVEPDKQNGGARPFSSLSRKSKALWNIFSQEGIRSNVINWWASHPAEKINGTVVSNLFQGVSVDPKKGWQISPGTVHPESKEKQYAQFKFFPNEMHQEHFLPFIPNAEKVDQEKDKRLFGFSKTFSEMMTTHAIATAVMEHEPWDFMAVYYTGIDHFSHGFMQYHPPKMKHIKDEDFEIYKDVITGAYRFHDMMLERLLHLAGEDTTVILCSDHGFQSGAFRPTGTPREPAGPAVWHRQYGILVMNGEGIKKDERIYGASLVDIGPTILQLYGLPIGQDMDGRPLVEAFEDEQEIKTIATWEEVDGDHGMHDENASISASQSTELLNQFVALGYIDDQGNDKEKQARSADIESKYNLARCLLWQERNDEAIPLLEEILFLSPWETRFIIQLADAYFRAGYLRQAEKLIASAFDLDSTATIQAVIIYARVKLALKETELALKYLTAASKRTPRFPTVHVQIGDAFVRLRRWKLAEKSFLNAINLHPEMAPAHLGLSTVYLRTGENQKAIDSALDAVSLVHRLPGAHMNLGTALARENEFDRSIVAFQTAARFSPKSPNPHRMLAKMYQLTGQNEAADKHRRRSTILREAASIVRKTGDDRKEKLFDLPELGTEDERSERLIKERPNPNDEVKKSGKSFVLVSGLPRSGTSLMMQMLVAGGIEAVTDNIREADEDNPKGYYEWEDIKQVGERPEILDKDEFDGKVIKTISALLQKMPREHDYKVIFMMRPIEEIVKSQSKMIDHRGEQGADLDEYDLMRGLTDHRNSTLNWLKDSKDMEFLPVSYPKLTQDPESVIKDIAEFLGTEILPHPELMKNEIDVSLYRNRVSG